MVRSAVLRHPSHQSRQTSTARGILAAAAVMGSTAAAQMGAHVKVYLVAVDWAAEAMGEAAGEVESMVRC